MKYENEEGIMREYNEIISDMKRSALKMLVKQSDLNRIGKRYHVSFKKVWCNY
jgi:hypothetical protein